MFKNFLPIFYRLKHKITFSIASFIKTDEHQELLKTVDTQLLIWNHELVDPETGARAELADMGAETIAAAAKILVSKKAKNKQKSHLVLFLPNVEFVATEYELPGMAVQNIASALSYQVNELMPAYPGELMLAVNHDETRDKNIALWLDYDRTESLFSAFKAQAIELTAIIPRIIPASLTNPEASKKNQLHQFREHDDDNLLQITLSHQNLIQWRSITHRDTRDETYFQAWEKDSGSFEHSSDNSAVKPIQINNADFWSVIDGKYLEQIAYAFFPESARRNLKKHSRLKKGRLAAIAGILVIMLIATPFIKNSVRYAKWDKRYQEYKEKTVEVRKMRSSVTQFEDNWALFIDYPKADIAAVIHQLNKIIPTDSWIKGFEIKDGFVELDGYSPNPTGILELISQQEEFGQVAFNQRTQSERGKKSEHFGITFRLNNIDVEAYQEKYFPVN